jgi:hypothetical protein
MFGPDGAGPQHGPRLLLASLLGVLLGALLVSLTFITGSFGEVTGYVITAVAGIGSGHLVGLVAGRREVPVACLSIVAGVLLVVLVFFQQALSMQEGMDTSLPLTLVFFCIPLAVLSAVGGWLAELARGRGFWSGGGRVGSPVRLSTGVLAGTAVAIFVVLGVLMLYSGIFEESPSEALETAFQAANEGDYDTADRYLTRQLIGDLHGNTRGYWDSVTENGSVSDTSTLVEELQGGSARVQIFLQYETGGSFSIVVPMTRQDGKWKVLPQ